MAICSGPKSALFTGCSKGRKERACFEFYVYMNLGLSGDWKLIYLIYYFRYFSMPITLATNSSPTRFIFSGLLKSYS